MENDVGQPELPVIVKKIAIPECSGMIIKMIAVDSILLDSFNVYPVPKHRADSIKGNKQISEMFFQDNLTYSSNIYFPAASRDISHIGYMRSQRIAEVSINPILFNPGKNELKIYSRFEIQITFVEPSTDIISNVGIFNGVLKHTLLNYVSNGMTPIQNILQKVQVYNLNG